MHLRIFFLQPLMSEVERQPELIFQNYLSLGTLISGLKKIEFVKNYAITIGKENLLNRLNETHFDIDLMKIFLPLNESQIIKKIETFFKQKEYIPEIMCTTATSNQIEDILKLAEIIKFLAPNCLCVIGGPFATTMPKKILRNSKFDIACIGEGVETIVHLCLSFLENGKNNYKFIPRIAYKNETGKIFINSKHPFVFPLDYYPDPSDSLDYFLDRWEIKGKIENIPIFILGGFGCPRSCIFCSQKAIHTEGIRERSAESIFEEINKLYLKGFRRFVLVQETFLRNKIRVKKLCELIQRSGINIEWSIEAHANEVSYSILFKMAEVGLKLIQIGVESGDPNILKKIGKNLRLKKIVKVINWCKILNIHTTLYFLVGLPRQDWASILRSALFLRKYCPFNQITFHIGVAIAIPYPGSKIEKLKSVKIVNINGGINYPTRNPLVGDDTKMEGKNFTETDDMTSEDILESYFYFENFCYFLMQSVNNFRLNIEGKLKAQEFANRNFYAIQRRTLRDLIIRAVPHLTPITYRKNRAEILALDKGLEKGIDDLNPLGEEKTEDLTNFLVNVRFKNGFHVLKKLTVVNRIKWMIICSLLWKFMDFVFHFFEFEIDAEEEGEKLNQKLNIFSIGELINYLDSKTITPFGIMKFLKGNIFLLDFIFKINHDGNTIMAYSLS